MIEKKILRVKIFNGIKLAVDNLIAERAKNDESLIISENGKIIEVKAREILKQRNEDVKVAG